MKKSSLIISVIVGGLICVAMWLFLGRTFDSNRSASTDGSYEIDMLVKNLTWDTDFEKKVPFRAGDKVQMAYVVKNLENTKRKVRANMAPLTSILQIATVSLDDEEKLTHDFSLTLEPYEVKTVYVEGTTHTGSEAFSGVIEKTPQTIFQTQQITPPAQISSGTTATPSDTTTSSNGGGGSVVTSPAPAVSTPVSTTKILRIGQSRFQSHSDNALFLDISDVENIDYVMIGEKGFKTIASTG